MVFAFLEHHIGTKRHTHLVEPEYVVSDEAASDALTAFGRMATGEPLQYITGVADFYGRRFRVTPDVLIPRPETELLCRNALLQGRVPRILDLCTGSGCIAWTLALEMPGAKVTAVDISDGALEQLPLRTSLKKSAVQVPSSLSLLRQTSLQDLQSPDSAVNSTSSSAIPHM